MKTAGTYLTEAGEKLGVKPVMDYVVVEALEECLRDHERFVDEQLKKVEKISAQLADLNKKIDSINQRLSSGSDHTSYSGGLLVL